MKKIIATTLALSFSILMLASCGSNASSASSASSEASSSSKETSSNEKSQELSGVYRGTVVDYTEDLLTVEQVDGYDYGQTSIVFKISDDTVVSDNGIEIVPGAFVEITYDGALTRSLPPQGNADSVEVIASFSEGIIQNGTIKEVATEGDNYYISIKPMEEETTTGSEVVDDEFSGVVLIVPKDALENITEKELVTGAKISAVTSGIATASLPPQMPVVALLPYIASAN